MNAANGRTGQTVSKNSIYLEVFGIAGLYSVNYDRIIKITERSLLAGRIGVSYYNDNNSKTEYLIFPLELTTLRRKNKRHHLEYGFGVVLFLVDDSYSEQYAFIMGSLRLGYRYQKPEGGLLFRIGFTPIIPIAVLQPGSEFDQKIVPWGGISIGYSFKKHGNDL